MAKNYYAILDVTPGATEDEIRASYRHFAKEFHPDRYALHFHRDLRRIMQ